MLNEAKIELTRSELKMIIEDTVREVLKQVAPTGITSLYDVDYTPFVGDKMHPEMLKFVNMGST